MINIRLIRLLIIKQTNKKTQTEWQQRKTPGE